jgi:hypothetical protein
MNRETVRQIITEDLGMSKISAEMVPRILTDDQKQQWLHISSDLLHNAEMFDKVITGDETWCFQYDPETKHQNMRSNCISTGIERGCKCVLAAGDRCMSFFKRMVCRPSPVCQLLFMEVIYYPCSWHRYEQRQNLK